MCDYWKTGSADTIDPSLVLNAISGQYPLGLKTVYFTGGECLMFADKLFSLCGQIKEKYPSLKFGIITNGLLLKRYCREVAALFSKVIISLDAVDPSIYKAIRGVDGLESIKTGIQLLKSTSPQTQVNLRVLVLAENVNNLPDIIEFGIAEKIDRISFIPEDTSSESAFGRVENAFALRKKQKFDLSALEKVIRQIRETNSRHMGTLLRKDLEDLERVYRLYAGEAGCFPRCSKAYQSCVIGTTGTVSPCFFIHGSRQISPEQTLQDILSGEDYCRCVSDIAAHRYPVCFSCACPKELS